MSDILLRYGIASYVSDNILIVPFQTDFYGEVIKALRQDILYKLHEMSDICGLIIDVSHLHVLDLNNMEVLEETARMASIFGVMLFLVGLKPLVAVTLVQLGYEGKLNTALTIAQAIQRINHENETKLLNSEDGFFDVEDEEESEDEMIEDSAEHDG